MLLKQGRTPRHEGGFTLVELLVTMLIVTVGLLGLAKLQAAAVSNTAVSRTRALMTFQGESLAGMIRANPGFWMTSGTASNYPGLIVATNGTITNVNNLMVQKTGGCLNIAGTCTPANLAYEDMYAWAAAFNDNTPASAFPGATARIACVSASGGTCGPNPTQPHGYDITLTWNQKMVATNRSTVNSTTTTPVSMVLHVQP